MSTTQHKLDGALLSVILNYINTRGWTNYDRFAEHLSQNLVQQIEFKNLNIEKAVSESPGSFFRLNGITKQSFLSGGIVDGINEVAANVEEEQAAEVQKVAIEITSAQRSKHLAVQLSSHPAKRKQALGTAVFLVLTIFTIILWYEGVLKNTDISEGLAVVLIPGAAGSIVYGFTDVFERLSGVKK